MSMFYNVYSVDEAGQKLVYHGRDENQAKVMAGHCPAGALVYVVLYLNGRASGYVTQDHTVLVLDGSKAKPYFK